MNPFFKRISLPVVIFFVCLLILAIGIIFFQKSKHSDCITELKEIQVSDPYMQDRLPMGSKVAVEMGVFNCQDPQHEDWVLYRFSRNQEPVIKRVVAVPGDLFELRYDETLKGWTLKVNGENITSMKGTPYSFGVENEPPLKLAEKSRQGILGENEVILFSSFPPGDRDSGTFGIVHQSDLIGRVKKSGVKKPNE